MTPTTEKRTRYPGLASFTTAQKDLFFGRKQETRDLFNLISVERTVVLFSKSGYGKTSLLQAGVMPLLYGQWMVPVPVRFGTDALSPESHFSIQLDTAWHRFSGKTETEAQKAARDTSNDATFWQQIADRPFGEAPTQFTPLFIFDQFEELFTLYPDPHRREVFVQQLADLIHERTPAALRERVVADLDAGRIDDAEAARLEHAPPMRFVFSIRSDMLHFMDELSEQIPYILRSRYQLFGLDEAQAIEAMERPALLDEPFASPRFGFEESAKREILSVLTKNNEVESFQLQSVCQAIEEKVMAAGPGTASLLRPGADGLPLVGPDFYGGEAGIGAIIEESYNRRLASLAQVEAGWPEAAHRLLEDALINKNGRRQSVDVVELVERHGADVRLLAELERQRLVRREPKLESFYYEISHDTWLAPVLKSRKARTEAEERERLQAQSERDRAEKLKAQSERSRARILAAGAIVAAGLAIFPAIYAIQQARRAEQAERSAVAKQQEAEAALQQLREETRRREQLATDDLLREVDILLESGNRDMALRRLEKAQKTGNTDPRIAEKIKKIKK